MVSIHRPRKEKLIASMVLVLVVSALIACTAISQEKPESDTEQTDIISELTPGSASSPTATSAPILLNDDQTITKPALIPITPENILFLQDTMRLLHQATVLVFSPDSMFLAVGTLDDGVYLYPLSDFAQPVHFTVDGIIRGLDFSPDGTQLAVLSWFTTDNASDNNAVLSVWDIAGNQEIDQAGFALSSFPLSDPQELDLLPGILQTLPGDQPGYLISDIHNSRMRQGKILRLDQALNLVYEKDLPLFTINSCPALLEGQQMLVYGGRFYDLNSGNWLNSSPLFQNRISCMTAEEEILAFAAAGDYSVRLANIQEFQISILANLQGASDEILSLSLHPQNDLIAASTRNHQVYIWDTANGDLLRVVNGTYQAVFSPDGATLAVIHADQQLGSIAPWSVRIFQVPLIPENYSKPEQAIATPQPTITPTEINLEPTTIPTLVTSYTTCSDAMPSNLVSNMAVIISPEVLGVRVRTSPGIEQALVTSFSPNDRVSIMDGPVCADGYTWWLIQRNRDQIQGWAAEGGDQVYWILPCTPERCP